MSKTSVNDLAFWGGISAFEETLHIGRPNIGNHNRLLERINDMLDRRWLSNNGPFVKEFEQKLAAFLGVKHCITMCNATYWPGNHCTCPWFARGGDRSLFYVCCYCTCVAVAGNYAGFL